MRKLTATLAALALSVSAFAVTPVFDSANFVETARTAANAVQQVGYLKQQVETQLEQWKVQLKQLEKLDPRTVADLVARNSTELQNATQMYNAVQQLYGSVEQVRGNFNSRLDLAKTMGYSFDQYMAYEQARINKNVESAVKRAQEEKRAVDRAQRDLEFATEAASKIDSTSGVHASMNQVNLQVNRLITQQADLLQMMSGAANASGLAVEEAMQQNERDARRLERRKRLAEVRKEREASEERARALLNGGAR